MNSYIFYSLLIIWVWNIWSGVYMKLTKSWYDLQWKSLKIPSWIPSFLKTKNSFFFFIVCWNSKKCQWLEFRPLRCFCCSLIGPFSTTQKDKNPKLCFFFFFFFFFGARVYIRAFHIGLFQRPFLLNPQWHELFHRFDKWLRAP